jgi:hypothetical protein
MPAVISETVLVLAGRLGERLDAERVADAISRGLVADGHLECDVCTLETDIGTRSDDASKPLDHAGFDQRMRAARALVIACEHLDDHALAGSIAFEAATRSRQSGVPTYAITGHDALDPFEARIVDLQVILEASAMRALSTAGRKLAGLI